jgi:hypothetical protein
MERRRFCCIELKMFWREIVLGRRILTIMSNSVSIMIIHCFTTYDTTFNRTWHDVHQIQLIKAYEDYAALNKCGA